MKSFLASTLVAAGFALSAGAASAATLGLTTEAPTIEASFAVVDFFDLDPDGDLSTFDAEVDFTDEVSLTDPAFISFGFGYSLADPTDGPTGGFDIFEDFGFSLALSGDLEQVGFFTDTIELLFGSLTGSAAGSFGSQALMTIIFDDPLGDNPFDAFVDGEIYNASISVSSVAAPAVIPLPAGLPLLLTGLLGLGSVRRRSLDVGRQWLL